MKKSEKRILSCDISPVGDMTGKFSLRINRNPDLDDADILIKDDMIEDDNIIVEQVDFPENF